MSVRVLPLVRRSICPCGEPVLDEAIQIGVKYRVDPSTIRLGFSYRCGKCGQVQDNIVVVDASQQLNPDLPMAPLPLGLFFQSQGSKEAALSHRNEDNQA